jgi:multiple sugar transport system permease protein
MRAMKRRRRRRFDAATLGRVVLIGSFIIFILVPLYWVFVTSIKPSNDYLAVPPVWFPKEPTLTHYTAALSPIGGSAA